MLERKSTHPLGDLNDFKNNVSGESEVTLAVTKIPALVQVFAKKGQEDALAKKLKIATAAGQASDVSGFTALPLAPNQWILVSKKKVGPAFADDISKKIGALGYVSEQSESRVRIRISGQKARELMSRGCRLDLHPSVVSQDYCAQTVMAQIGVLLHIVEDGPVYELYVYSGFARSFWHWLTETAQQFDCQIK